MNNTVPDDFMHCLSITDDYTTAEPMEVEENVPDVAETVDLTPWTRGSKAQKRGQVCYQSFGQINRRQKMKGNKQ